MKMKIGFTLLAAVAVMWGQQDRSNSLDTVSVQVGDAQHPLPLHKHGNASDSSPVIDLTGEQAGHFLSVEDAMEHGPLGHPFTVVARHPVVGCEETAVCGQVFFEDAGFNLRTTAGTNWQYAQMAGSPGAAGTYMGLSATTFTPAEADSTLNGELNANNITRQSLTAANTSGVVPVPGTPSVSVVGTGASTTYYYWAAGCNQGICTTPSVASGTTSTSNGTLSGSNYNSVSWTENLGSATHQLYRTTSNSQPSGTVTDLVGGIATCVSATATTQTCTQFDTSNTLTSVTIPGSNLTNTGSYTLVNTWTDSGSATSNIQAFGVFTASSGGSPLFEGTFTPVSLNSGDTLQVTETVRF